MQRANFVPGACTQVASALLPSARANRVAQASTRGCWEQKRRRFVNPVPLENSPRSPSQTQAPSAGIAKWEPIQVCGDLRRPPIVKCAVPASTRCCLVPLPRQTARLARSAHSPTSRDRPLRHSAGTARGARIRSLRRCLPSILVSSARKARIRQ